MFSYKFRPANNNPYLQLPQQEPEDEIEMNEMYVFFKKYLFKDSLIIFFR